MTERGTELPLTPTQRLREQLRRPLAASSCLAGGEDLIDRALAAFYRDDEPPEDRDQGVYAERLRVKMIRAIDTVLADIDSAERAEQSEDSPPQSPLDDATLREVVAAAWVKFINEWRRTTPEYVAEDVAEFFVRKHRTVARQIAVEESSELKKSSTISDEALAQIAELGYAVVDTSLKCIGHSEQSLVRQKHEECKAQLREAVETVSGVKQALTLPRVERSDSDEDLIYVRLRSGEVANTDEECCNVDRDADGNILGIEYGA